MLQEKIVYVVHCVDTEGPLYESLDATFERLWQIFNIRLEPTKDNLKKLQNGEIDLGPITKTVQNLISPGRVSFNETWEDIGGMLGRITSLSFRNEVLDSFGNGWIYNWFCVDHVGYTSNPRRRDIGDHRVFDYYTNLCKKEPNTADRIYFHYHPLPYNGIANASATFYFNNNHLFEIFAKKIIDRQWFSPAFRPGFHAIRPDSHWFLEQWFPFDYSNQSVNHQVDQPDLAEGRFGDWRRAPGIWGAYHPDHDDYQKEGNCRRSIFRCLNIESRIGGITLENVEEAFKQASERGSAVLSFTNHDYRDMTEEVNKVRNLLKYMSEKQKDVKFKYCNALEAARAYLKLVPPDTIGLDIQFINSSSELMVMKVKTDVKNFGPQPFLAIKNKEGKYFYDNLDFGINPKEWHYIFDWQTFLPSKLEKIGIAAVDVSGVCEVLVYDSQTGEKEKRIIRD